MKVLIKRSYQAVTNRGLIKKCTHIYQFLQKITEEFEEVQESCDELYTAPNKKNKDHYIEELTDLATVCIMQITHLGYDFEKEFESVVLKNEKRANNEQ